VSTISRQLKSVSRTGRPTLRIEPSLVAFAALLALGAVLVLVETRGLTFFADEWDFLLHRRGLSADSLLRPHGPHLVVIPILVYKLLLELFGGSSYLPFRLLAAADLVLIGLVLGIVCRRFWGAWAGLVPVALLVTLGPAGSTLLWPFQVGYAVAVAAGVSALVAVERGSRGADGLAVGALLVSLGSGSLGVGFVVGVLVMIVLNGAGWRSRLWVPLIPAALYALWYLDYGRAASQTHLSLWHNSLHYAFDGLGATLGALAGLATVSPQIGVLETTAGAPLALATLGTVALAMWRGWRPHPLVCATAATLTVLWIAASLSSTPQFFRPPEDPRYLATNALLVLICLCAAVPRPRLRRGGIVTAAVLLVVIAATNAWEFTLARNYERANAVASRAELGGLLIMQGVAPPHFSADGRGPVSYLLGVTEANFSLAARDFGFTGDAPAALRLAPEPTRELVDRQLAVGEGVSVTVRAQGRPRCTAPLAVGAAIIPGRYELIAPAHRPASLALRRFATIGTVDLGPIAPGAAARFLIPADRAAAPWRAVSSEPAARLCRVS
jgi:hypothetical protein